jgi:hypothetical protein
MHQPGRDHSSGDQYHTCNTGGFQHGSVLRRIDDQPQHSNCCRSYVQLDRTGRVYIFAAEPDKTFFNDCDVGNLFRDCDQLSGLHQRSRNNNCYGECGSCSTYGQQQLTGLYRTNDQFDHTDSRRCNLFMDRPCLIQLFFAEPDTSVGNSCNGRNL